MANYTGSVATGSDDGNDQGTGTDYIEAYYLDGFPSPTEYIGFASLTTSGVDTDDITSATLYWYNHSYTKSRSATFRREILIWNGSSYSSIYLSTATPSTGWESHALTSGEISYINNYVSNTKTLFHFEVGDPGGGLNRQWLVRAYEYGTTDGEFSPYLDIEYTAPTSEIRKGRIIII